MRKTLLYIMLFCFCTFTIFSDYPKNNAIVTGTVYIETPDEVILQLDPIDYVSEFDIIIVEKDSKIIIKHKDKEAILDKEGKYKLITKNERELKYGKF